MQNLAEYGSKSGQKIIEHRVDETYYVRRCRTCWRFTTYEVGVIFRDPRVPGRIENKSIWISTGKTS